MNDEQRPEEEEFDHSDFPFLDNESPDRAAEYFRLALDLIGRRRAAPIPLNYALCYFYVAGSNLLLNEKMDGLLCNGTEWDHAAATKLFMRYFTPCSDTTTVDLQQELLQVVSSIVDSVTDVAGNTSQRSDRLDRQIKQLGESKSAQQAIRIASEIMQEARQLAADSRTLESSLQTSVGEVHKLREELLHARREASIDALTGLNNRRAFDKALAQLMRQKKERGQNFSLIFMDVDHFKQINDQHGHLVGDRVLRQLAKQLSARTRQGDTVCRYGGEEFAVLLPATDLGQAQQIAEQVRLSIGRLNMRRTDSNQSIGTVTASFGVAQFQADETAQRLVQRADEALYRAKKGGRNCVVAA